MKIKAPCIITPRLLPGLKVSDSFISIEYGDWVAGRQAYHLYIDTPEFEWTDADKPNAQIRSGVGGGSLQVGLHAALSFLGACAESLQHQARNRCDHSENGENGDLFPAQVGEWAVENADEIGMLDSELEETPSAIEE